MDIHTATAHKTQSFFVTITNTRNESNGSNELTVMHQNIGGLINKLDQIQIALHDFYSKSQEIDIICLSETFLKKGSEQNVKIENFKHGAFYSRNACRGGTAILVNKNLQVKQIDFQSKLATDYYFECCGIEIIGLDVVIIVIYRIPVQTKSHVGIFMHKLDILLFQLRRLEY